jgi:hypothetical protein
MYMIHMISETESVPVRIYFVLIYSELETNVTCSQSQKFIKYCIV